MKVFIDAGHNNSGFNTGAVGNGLKEQDITFAVAKKLGDILSKQGISIKLSRAHKETNLGTSNTTSINTRYTMANNWKADYFISIHCNAGGGTGTETLYYRDDSISFALMVQENFVKEMGLRDRGVKFRDNVGVVRNTKMPSILLELAFIDNRRDAKILRDKQDEMAQAIAKGVFGYIGVSPKVDGEEEMGVRYNTVNEVPEWARATIKKLIAKGYLSGDGKSLNLSDDMIRLLIINDRAGLYK